MGPISTTCNAGHALLEWSAAGRALHDPAEGGESGDLHVIAPFDGGVLAAVIDGLGHGIEAALAAELAADVLREHAGEELRELVHRCHERLRRTRGAVMSLVSFDNRGSLKWMGVGNVEGILLPADASLRHETIPIRGGVVGYQLPPLREAAVEVAHGDLLVMVSDGIRSGFTTGIDLQGDPEEIADMILALHARHSDDALVLAARYVGDAKEVYAPLQAQGDASLASSSTDEALQTATQLILQEEVDITIVRQRVRAVAIEHGLPSGAVEALATATTEIARNVIQHAGAGDAFISTIEQAGRRGICVTVRDHGPGITDVHKAMCDGYSTANGLGLGLPSARRLMDEFEVSSTLGVGTSVVMKKWLPHVRAEDLP